MVKSKLLFYVIFLLTNLASGQEIKMMQKKKCEKELQRIFQNKNINLTHVKYSYGNNVTDFWAFQYPITQHDYFKFMSEMKLHYCMDSLRIEKLSKRINNPLNKFTITEVLLIGYYPNEVKLFLDWLNKELIKRKKKNFLYCFLPNNSMINQIHSADSKIDKANVLTQEDMDTNDYIEKYVYLMCMPVGKTSALDL